MRLPVEQLIDWLDARAPDWYGIVVGLFTGALGVAALSFLEAAIFGVQSLFFFMPFIVLFAGASGGFKFWEKSPREVSGPKKMLAAASGLMVGGFAWGVQQYVDRKFFETDTSFGLILILTASGLLGGFLGGLLKKRSDELSGPGGDDAPT